MAGVFDQLAKITPGVNSDGMGQAVEDMVGQAIMRRRAHERRWYDNNFFDDGYHFRIISKKTGRVIDTVNRSTGYVERAIPRASRQIRGLSNLLFSAEPYPVVYPERIVKEEFASGPPDPQTGQPTDSPQYQAALDKAKTTARLRGLWLSSEWEDEQHLQSKLLDMFILAAKNSISYLQVYSNPDKQKIITKVFDAFDLILFGDRRTLNELPFITKAEPWDLARIKASPLFDPKKVKRLTPDDRYATSEIKNAYMRARYGSKLASEGQASLIVKETFLKEYLTEDNWAQVVKFAENASTLDGKSKGDMVMRHVFSAGGITLSDEYIDYDDYPFAEYRFEPGPLYQVPLIERFIPQNKSLDVIVTRLEKWVNSMVVGVYQQRKGENMQVSNFPGGQIVQYEQTPLDQMEITNVGNTPFQVIGLLDKYIEEQGAATSVLGQIPQGVKGQGAIENLQQQEYSNLKMSTLMQKRCIQRIAQLMLERAHKDFLEPKEVTALSDGQPEHFDVIGQRGLELSKQVNKPLSPDIVPLSNKTQVRIEIEPGLGLTMDGKKQAMQNIIDYMTKLYELGFLSGEAMSQAIKKFLETFGYGSTEEFMEAVENGVTQGQMSKQQIQQMQIAIAQTLKDTQMVGPQADAKNVMATKVGVLESLKESGLIDSLQGQSAAGLDPKDLDDDLVKIYQYATPEIRRQIESKLGLSPATDESVSPKQVETAEKIHKMVTTTKQVKLQEAAQNQAAQAQDRQQGLAETQAAQAAQAQQASQELAQQQLEQQGGANGSTNGPSQTSTTS